MDSSRPCVNKSCLWLFKTMSWCLLHNVPYSLMILQLTLPVPNLDCLQLPATTKVLQELLSYQCFYVHGPCVLEVE